MSVMNNVGRRNGHPSSLKRGKYFGLLKMKKSGFTEDIISDGKVHISTPYSRLLGKAPIMVAGMTPSTVKAGFVSAILRAGYHV